MVVFNTGWPNAELLMGPHSPFDVGFVSTQSGMKLPVRGSPAPNCKSFHVRVTLVTIAIDGDTDWLRPPP